MGPIQYKTVVLLSLQILSIECLFDRTAIQNLHDIPLPREILTSRNIKFRLLLWSISSIESRISLSVTFSFEPHFRYILARNIFKSLQSS